MKIAWKYEKDKLVEKAWMKLAWLLPRKLVYYSVVRMFAEATTTNHNDFSSFRRTDMAPPDLPVVDAMKAWEGRT